MNGVSLLDFNDAAPQGWVPPAASLDREAILSRAKMQLEPLLQMLFPHGKRRGREFVVGNLQGEPGDSLRVALEGARAGMWIDHATGESGDIFDLIAAHHGLDTQADFARVLEIAGQLVGRATSHPPKRKKSEAPVDELGPATAKWDYLDAAGNLIACVYRYDPAPGRKEFRPWDAKRRKMAPPEPRPLYNQPGIATAEQVILVEGEKCAQALIEAGTRVRVHTYKRLTLRPFKSFSPGVSSRTNKELNTMTTTILALDLGTTTGWALAGHDGLISGGSESFKPQRFEGGGMRYLRFKRWLTDIKQCADGIDWVVFEEVRKHAGVDAAHAYGGFMAHLTAWCEHHQIPYQGVPVGTIKKHATGKGNAGKAEMIAAAKTRGFDPVDDNHADALALLDWAMAQGGVA